LPLLLGHVLEDVLEGHGLAATFGGLVLAAPIPVPISAAVVTPRTVIAAWAIVAPGSIAAPIAIVTPWPVLAALSLG
jgi:hypothetical protein